MEHIFGHTFGNAFNSQVLTLCIGIQGDECDSSDEEWDMHIGSHARAFLGLHEPVAELALDDGVGIGMLVRNAFARADNIHMRASTLGCSAAEAPGGSPTHQHLFNEHEPFDINMPNSGTEALASHASPDGRLFGSRSDTEMLSNSVRKRVHGHNSVQSESRADVDSTQFSGLWTAFWAYHQRIQGLSRMRTTYNIT